jgi:glycosyltransferase involved in cell wall biosynthesis
MIKHNSMAHAMHETLSENMPKVSVIISTFNYGHFITRAVHSVLAQTFGDFELLVVDDGSEDNTRELVQQVHDQRLHYFWQHNQGPSAARNTGIRLARGEYLAFLDADDEWYPDKMQAQLEMICNQPQVGLVYGHCEYIDSQGHLIDTVRNRRKGDLFIPLLRSNFITGTASSIMVRRACFDQLGGFSLELTAVEDWHLAVRIAAHWLVDFVDQVVARIHYHPSSLSKNIERVKANTLKSLSLLETEYSDRAPKTVWRQARSYAYLNAGRVYGIEGDLTRARPSFWQAVRVDPLNFTSYPFLAASLLGHRAYARLRTLKRSTTPNLGI